ncbi:MAG: aminopeptidase [Lacunisphaera sp.]
MALAETVRAIAGNATIITANPDRLRPLVEVEDARALDQLFSEHIARLHRHLSVGGAFLFLTGSAPRLFDGVHPVHIAKFEQLKWRHLGPLIQPLIRGATQWTLAPAPTAAWAEVAYADLPPASRLDALWRVVFDSLRIGPALVAGPSSDQVLPTSDSPTNKAVASWQSHLAALALRRDGYNAAHHRRIRYVGTGTDLTLELSRSHVWCTAQLTSKAGVPFVVNLPTEEVFTAPNKDSAHGRVYVTRPIIHAGTMIDGITLEFLGGKIVAAHAETGRELLQQLLATDEGARRIGEVAIVPNRNALSLAGRFFHHTLLDENAISHIALGEAYRFCSSAWLPLALNSSQIHVDLPLDARIELA